MILSSAEDSLSPHWGKPSLWGLAGDQHVFPTLQSDLSVDVAVIGGGITGITIAEQLSRAGHTVVVLEAQRVGFGTTGHATGNLYATTDEFLYKLVKKWGNDKVAEVVRSRQQAIDTVERNIAQYRLQCDFTRQPWVLYSIEGTRDESHNIDAECDAARYAGLDARIVHELPLPFKITKALIVREQAQFNPLRYVRDLAAAIRSEQCLIFEESPIIDIDLQNSVVNTAAHSVKADHIVMATHTPKGFDVVQTELGPYQEYAIAALQEGPPLVGGIFWSCGTHSTSVRSAVIKGKPYILLIGEKHKTGQNADPNASYQRLEDMLRARFQAQQIEMRWSAQQFRAADGIPYIGSSDGTQLYIATGFAADGLTYGTLAGMMICDEIRGIVNPYAELYSPRRFTPVKSAVNFLKENINVAGRYLKDYVQTPPVKNFNDLVPDQGALVDLNGEKLAAYRDTNGEFYLHSAVCPHLKCIVQWNQVERSWDCPCHGSRFHYDGNIIEGPAMHPLHRHVIDNEADPDIV
jgi:glycine/D-amino acid oxidase-like deaminating enzyme/nitrite reductase/ring-hydroxylating ferredoxin subunit